MATTVTKVIDPDAGAGYDYDSLYDWEAAQQGDLTGARDEIAVAKCRCTGGTADSTAFQIDGWTTSTTQYIKIWTDPAESYRHNGTYQTGNKYRLACGGNYTSPIKIYGSADDFRIIGLQIVFTGNHTEGEAAAGIWVQRTSGGAGVISHCVILRTGTGSQRGIRNFSDEGTVTIYNNIVYDFYNGIELNPITGTTWTAYNNTVHGCSNQGIVSANYSTGTSNIKNNICNGNGTDYYFEGGHTRNTATNISEDTSSPNDTYDSIAVTFVDEDGDDFHLASAESNAIGNGTNLYNDATYPFQDDIDGNDRGGSGAQWDIGAVEYVSVSVIPVFMKTYKSRRQ